ncbi:hypothetical protein M9Y82_10235 [Leptospira weilii]|uniref:Uncharacterized protein n=1 Tax=Leptospira weilii str. 2006001855 TaxID=996804 RepID=M6FRN5_9LEPT|nr:hypothetical protein [Leptospira weilii]EMM73832.1 hypothetical protein LEP1GSC038_2360 [Leptospira weilii str. 2006001855]MCL8267013.1 hypothetical protein [Leptospira weilii]
MSSYFLRKDLRIVGTQYGFTQRISDHTTKSELWELNRFFSKKTDLH